ncbi:MAG: photosystem II assembly protein [Nostoc sp. DedVER02]|uniref:photosystem II assembly protein n=1 Tax=unclassified Nostoc TaxID=2593658 RepID=UPI002AD28798|nr:MULTISPECIES: photosystem II assembly protein [unclassified Nostoc]MDZ7987881.1 photosystem II assembly protein [Nostoc sp. DedVER02]MDZ8114562.1 photosystem II assembly protein [Nostoc sp. DedVER01b]
MNKIIINWWRSQQFKLSLKRGDIQRAVQLLQEIQKSGARFSWLEKLFRDKLQLERYSQEYKRQTETLSQQIAENLKTNDNFILMPDEEFVKYIYKVFSLIQHDEYKLQSTGIDERIFDELESKLVEYLKEEFSKIPDKQLFIKLEDALEDINNLKIGQEPDYRFSLTPHVYFMKYFLENVYCTYLAWFLIYQDALLPSKVNILDIAAGPGTVAYGLALFLQSSSGFFDIPQMHISYYSLEKQDAFQFRGLQFWRRYIESRLTTVNAYFRFVTTDIFNWENKSNNLPKDFFDFIVISHCFFTDPAKRVESNNTYKQIFATSLKNSGYILLIVQDKKLFKIYDVHQSENKEQEKIVVDKFLAELGLEMVWYKYLTSTSSRIPLSGAKFGKFAQENLPEQLYMSQILQQYFSQKYQSCYTLDDYVILAKKS